MLSIKRINQEQVSISGRLDASNAQKASDFLSQHQGPVVIDMSDLAYISSMGLSILVETYKRLDAEGHSMTLKNLNSHVRDVFRFTRLDQLMTIE